MYFHSLLEAASLDTVFHLPMPPNREYILAQEC